MEWEPFYRTGLRFSCQQCSFCCRGSKGGHVMLSEQDVQRLADWARLSTEQFERQFCQWVQVDSRTQVLCLREQENRDCLLWQDGCTAYPARPVQCRTYPFWEHIMQDASNWQQEGNTCPGINCGEFHSAEEIEHNLRQHRARAVLCRAAPEAE